MPHPYIFRHDLEAARPFITSSIVAELRLRHPYQSASDPTAEAGVLFPKGRDCYPDSRMHQALFLLF